MAAPSRMAELADLFRQALLARERAAAVALVRAYGLIWKRLQTEISAVRAEVEAMRAAGETITRGELLRLERLQAIQGQVKAELRRYVEFADGEIADWVREAIRAGEQDAYQLLLAGFPPEAKVRIGFTRMNPAAVESMVGVLRDGSPLKDLLVEAVGEAAEGFMDTMVHGLAVGWGPEKLARELRREFGMGLTRALRIARTEQLRAYRTAALEQYRRSGLVKGWERYATKDDRTCMACIVLDGKFYSLDEEMDDHPNGRCAMLPVTKTYEELGLEGVEEPAEERVLAKDWFLEQDEVTQRRMLGRLYEAWKEGKFALEDLVKWTHSDVWGDSATVKSLKELLGE